MKKVIFIPALLVTLVFASCGSVSVENSQTVTGGRQQESTTLTPPPTKDSTSKPLPSFSDGQLYLQAIGAHDAKLCAKIGDSDLRGRCDKNAK